MTDLLLPRGTPDPVADFCQSVFSKHSEQWPIKEDTLAEEFLAFAGLQSVVGVDEVVNVCRDRLGISVCHTLLPDGLRGHNLSYASKREILVSTKQDFHAATLHTLLHELREILECEFREQGHPISDDPCDIEERAEAFAALVQVGAACKAVPVLFDSAAVIEFKWLRVGAYVLIVVGALAYALYCIAMPQMEDSFATLRASRRALESENSC